MQRSRGASQNVYQSTNGNCFLKSSKGIITFAYGSASYIELAVSLARSLQRFSPNIPSAIVTDSQSPDLQALFRYIIPVDLSRGTDVTQKLYLDIYSPFEKTLFIDCDCIVVDDLEWVFQKLAGGTSILPNGTVVLSSANPKRCVDFSVLEKTLGIGSFREFNGGLYYIEKATLSESTFIRARELLEEYRAYGFSDYRNHGPPDELLLGCAMEQLGNSVIRTSKPVIQSPYEPEDQVFLDVVRGTSTIVKKGWGTFDPSVVHFGFAWKDHPTYIRERYKLAILALEFPGVGLLARSFSIGFDIWTAISGMAKKAWPYVPRPIRLACHGGISRVRKLRFLGKRH